MEFLTPYRKLNRLNPVEQFKQARHPLDVAQSIIDNYSKNGVAAIDEVPGEYERLKWAGLYPQKQGGDAFMLRVKAPAGRLTAAQARVVGEITQEFAKPPEAHPTYGFEAICDVTTRQDVQIHWVKIGSIPEIWRRFEEVGLTTIQACGDSARNVLCCPVSGLGRDEAFDASPIASEISDYFTGNREYANLPRKFKICVTGCLDDCAQSEINDIGLRPARSASGELGFNVLVGGGLSDGPRMASDIDVFVPLDGAVEVTRAIAQLYGELGNRENRGICRMRYLVEELSPEVFRSELVKRSSIKLAKAGEDLTRGYRGDHIGIHPQSQDGLSYAGLNVTVGRMTASNFVEAARLAEEYGGENGEVRLATDQNIVITGIPNSRLDEFLAEPLVATHSPFPGPFERGVVACTGNEYCRFAIVETKVRATEWAQEMDKRFADRWPSLASAATGNESYPVASSYPDRDVVRMHFSGCSASCAQPQIADIGFRGDTAFVAGEIVEACDIGLGGSLGNDASFVNWVEGAKPVDQVEASLGDLFESYLSERRSEETFRQWVRRNEPQRLRAILSPELSLESAGGK